jgi:hypothetical protein
MNKQKNLETLYVNLMQAAKDDQVINIAGGEFSAIEYGILIELLKKEIYEE